MYTLPRTYNLHRSLVPVREKPPVKYATNSYGHYERVLQELRDLGVTRFALMRAEARYLPRLIHADEHIKGVVYGRHQEGHAMLVATDKRIIFLDKKPLFINADEMTYFIVSGIRFTRAAMSCTVTLHTRVKDFSIRTFNAKCAEAFVEYIESRSLEQQDQLEVRYDQRA